MFKFVVVCVALFGAMTSEAAVSEAQKAIIQGKFLAGGVSCLKDHPLSFSDIKTLRNKMLPDGDNAKCFAECLFKKIGIMDDMAMVSAEGARKQAAQVFKNSEDHLEKVEQFIETCSTVNKQDVSEAGAKGCDRAKVLFTCLVDNAPKFGFDVDF